MGEQAISKKARRVEDVRRRILTQVFEPGSYLDEAELAQPYYISRPPLREALNQLPAENATEAQVMQLKDTQELFRKAIREGDAARNALMNQRFHAIIGEMVDNEFLRPSLRRVLIDHTRIGMSFYNPRNCSMAEQRSVAAGQHDQFIALIEQGDVEGAGQLGLRRIELPAGRTYRAVARLPGRRRLRQGPPDHVGEDAPDAGAGAGRQVHPVREARLREDGPVRRPAATAAAVAQ
ncbi:GntR family transcriptional regulator [Mameliella alba]|nr:GntR family transcriptional regulator [Mameliella alba]OWV68602.1 GntR family transcriptional regulator [Mameliella alba]